MTKTQKLTHIKAIDKTYENATFVTSDTLESVLYMFYMHYHQISKDLAYRFEPFLPRKRPSISYLHVQWLIAESFLLGRTQLLNPTDDIFAQSILDLALRYLHLDQTHKLSESRIPVNLGTNDVGFNVYKTKSNIPWKIQSVIDEMLEDVNRPEYSIAAELLDTRFCVQGPVPIGVCIHGKGFLCFSEQDNTDSDTEDEILNSIRHDEKISNQYQKGSLLHDIYKRKAESTSNALHASETVVIPRKFKPATGEVRKINGLWSRSCYCGTTPCIGLPENTDFRMWEKGVLRVRAGTVDNPRLSILKRYHNKKKNAAQEVLVSMNTEPVSEYRPISPQNQTLRISRYHSSHMDVDKEPVPKQEIIITSRCTQRSPSRSRSRAGSRAIQRPKYTDFGLGKDTRNQNYRDMRLDIGNNQREMRYDPAFRNNQDTTKRKRNPRQEVVYGVTPSFNDHVYANDCKTFNYSGSKPLQPHLSRGIWYTSWCLPSYQQYKPIGRDPFAWETENPSFIWNSEEFELTENIFENLYKLELRYPAIAHKLISTTNFRYFYPDPTDINRVDPLLKDCWGPGEIAVEQLHAMKVQLKALKEENEMLKYNLSRKK